MSVKTCILPHRNILMIEGEDRLEFLQGLISNDVNKVTTQNIVYAAFLTPQGKYLSDFFIFQMGDDALLLDIDSETFPAFKKKLMMYKLRSNVALKDVSDQFDVHVAFGGHVEQLGFLIDPRLKEAGYRAILPKGHQLEAAETVDFNVYDRHRISLGLPDATRDLVLEKSILLENGFDELNGVDWNKGCYMGQELTARTKYRGLVKKRLIPVQVEGELPEAGSEITSDGKVVGELRSSNGDLALATLKLDALDQPLSCGDAILKVQKPDWLDLAE